MGNLVFQATLGGQVNLVGPNTASTYNLNVPAVSSTIATTSGTETLTNKTLTTPVINGFTGDTSVVNIGSGQFYKDTSGNIGIGVTPSAWDSSSKAVQVSNNLALASYSSGTNQQALLLNNSYLSSTGYKYLNNNYATYYQQQASNGTHAWFTAASGTAGNTITFTQAMTLDASGNLGVGTTSPVNKIHVVGSATTNVLRAQASSSGDGIVLRPNAAGNGGDVFSVNSAQDTYTPLNLYGSRIVFGANGTESARIDSSGNLLVGGTNVATMTTGFNYQPSGQFSVNHHSSGTSSGTAFAYFDYAGAPIGSITQNGTTGVLYNLTSDYRLKNDPQPLTGAKEFVMALQPKKWQWWDGSGEGVGFIAHEFMEVAKYSGHGEKDAVDEEGNIIPQSIQPSSSEVMANLVAHIQELETRLAALENK